MIILYNYFKICNEDAVTALNLFASHLFIVCICDNTSSGNELLIKINVTGKYFKI
jgi:hypothetical protein